MKIKSVLLVILLSGFIFLIVFGSAYVAFPAQSQYSDLLISHYPNLIHLKHALFEMGEFPLWSDQILSGYPFYANPLSGLWYPLNWLTLIIPFPLSFNLMFVLHLIWGGIGMYFFMRQQRVMRMPAILSAVLFAFFPKIFAHFAAGHVTLVNAVYWMPWLLIATDSAFQQVNLSKWNKILPGVILGIIALADIRWSAFSAGLYFIYSAYVNGNRGDHPNLSGWVKKWLVTGLVQLVIFLGLSALVWVPLLQYSSLSTRSLMTMQDRLTLSIEPLRLIGLFFPDFGGYAEWIIYPGAVLVCLLPFMGYFRRNQDLVFWGWTSIFSLLFALGEYFFLAPVFYLLPGADLLRIPSRMIFIFDLSSAILVGYWLNAILILKPRIKPTTRMMYFVLCVFVTAIAVGVSAVTSKINFEMLWGAGGIVIISALLLIFLSKKIDSRGFQILFIGLATINLGVVSFSQIRLEPKNQAVPEIFPLSVCFDQKSLYRIYSPSYSVPQEQAALLGLELVDGVDPLQLIKYAKFMEKASGVPITGYSVTIPSFSSGDVKSDNQEAIPDLNLLGLLNVRYIVSSFPIQGMQEYRVNCTTEDYVYQNPFEKPRAWLETEEGVEQVFLSKISPNRMQIDTKSAKPGKLVLSEIVYPGWHVSVDGEERIIEPVQNILRSVPVPPGNHQVEFVFQPIDLPIAIAINLLTIGSIVIVTSTRKSHGSNQ